MYRIIKKDEGLIRKITDNKTAINLISKEITPNVSLALLEADNFNEEETTQYDRIYFVTEGKLTLTFGPHSNELVSGDSCFILKGTTYNMSGTFKTLVINQPAFGV